MLIRLIKSVNFKEAHIAKHLIHLTKTFPVKLFQIVVLDVSPKQVLARMTSQIYRGWSVNQIRCEMQTTFGTLKNHI